MGREAELDALRQALAQAAAGHGQLVAAVGEAGVRKSRLVYEFVHGHHPLGWQVLESASVSYGKATSYFPVVDLLKRYAHLEDGDEPRTVRAKVTGQVLTLDETLQETIPALLWLLNVLPDNSPFARSNRPNAVSVPWRPSSVCCCARARGSRCCSCLRTCIGLIARPRCCLIALLTVCPRPACYCWSTTAPSTSTAGAARHTIRNCASILCPQRVPVGP